MDGEEEFTGDFGTAFLYCGRDHTVRAEARNECGSASSPTFTFTLMNCEESNQPDGNCGPLDPDFEWQPAAPEPGQGLRFESAKRVQGGGVLSRWTFGDDGSSIGYGYHPSAGHTFAEPGVYEVRLDVQNQAGTASITKQVTVGSAPGLEISGPSQARVAEEVALTAEPSGCTPATDGWHWSLNGGAVSGVGTGARVDVAWSSPGVRQVQVTNPACDPAEARHEVTVTEPSEPRIDVSGPLSVEVERPATLTALATDCAPVTGGWTWELGGGELMTGGGTDTVTAAWDAAGTVVVTANNPGCGDAKGRHTLVVESGEKPRITAVDRELEGLFIEGTRLDNRFDVAVEWSGEPGEVRFSIDDRGVAAVPADTDGAAHAFSMARDFSASLEPWEVEIVAVNRGGVESLPRVEEVWVVPAPLWLDLARNAAGGFFDHGVEGGHLFYALQFEYPQPHLAADGPIDIPRWVPFIGGKFGLTETFFKVNGRLESSGSGSLELFGKTGFAAAGDVIAGTAKGSGNVAFHGGEGFVLEQAMAAITLKGEIQKKQGLLEVVPALKNAEKLPKVGGLMRRLNRTASVTGTFRAGLEMDAAFVQSPSGELAFTEGRGRLGLGLGGKVEVDLQRLKVKVEGDMDGGSEVGVPSPFLRGLWIEGRVGASATLDLLLDVEVGGELAFECRWPSEGALCGDETEALAREAVAGDLLLRPIHHPYELWGDASRVHGPSQARPGAGQIGGTASTGAEVSAVVGNVFPGAAPALLEAAGTSLLLWEHQDPEDPVHGSLEIAWTVEDGAGWSEMALLEDDARLELEPVAVADRSDRVVAAWLRAADPADAAIPTTLDEAAEFYRSLEVVSATFDPGSGTWSEVTPLTRNRSMDSNLRLEAAGSGRPLLTWLSNPTGEMLSTEASPTDVLYSFWNAGEARWTPVGTLAGSRAGVLRHASAVHGDAALVVVEREAAGGGGQLDVYRWDGDSWSATEAVPGSSHEDWGAEVVFDNDGDAHLVWVRDGEVVHWQVGASQPRPVGALDPSLGMVEPLFLTGPGGHLALIWPESGESGTADPFASFFDADHGIWSEARPLASLEAMVRGMGGHFDSDGTLRLAVTSTETAPGGDDGRSDLLRIDHRPERDLEVGPEMTLDPTHPGPGEPVRVTVELRSPGTLAVAGYAAELRSRLEDGGSRVEQAVESGKLLQGGALTMLSFDLAMPADALDLEVVVDPSNRIAEGDEGNNRVVAGLANRPPVPVIEADPALGPAPLTVNFDASASEDPDGQPLAVRWSFGDGSTGAEGPRVQHTFPRPGTFRVAALVSDGRTSRSAGLEVTVEAGGDRCASGEVLCLGDGRFEVTATWRTPDGTSGPAQVRSLTRDTGYLWFFGEDNVEVVVKVLDACTLNDRFWVFLAGLTNIEVKVAVRDVVSDEVVTYTNRQGSPFPPIQDTTALATCGE